jgi:hypothetical protein
VIRIQIWSSVPDPEKLVLVVPDPEKLVGPDPEISDFVKI